MSIKIQTNSKGYVIGVSCNKYHSGNRGLVFAQRGYYECQGCGNHYSDSSVREALSSPADGYTGGGGLAHYG